MTEWVVTAFAAFNPDVDSSAAATCSAVSGRRDLELFRISGDLASGEAPQSGKY